MPRICFLARREEARQPRDNLRLLIAAAVDLGWRAEIGHSDSLRLDLGQVLFLTEGGKVLRSADDFDILWILGLGAKDTFYDRMQLLKIVAYDRLIVNSPYALALWHGKLLPSSLCVPPLRCAETLAANEPSWLWRRIQHLGGEWVLKPPAGSHGEGVVRIHAGDPDAESIIAKATKRGSYCLVQRFVPEIRRGEKRVILAGGQIIGQYMRTASNTEFRTNLAQGAVANSCDLGSDEKAALRNLGKHLLTQGIAFAGVDLCWPWVLEINLANPGGLVTLAALGQDLGKQTMAAIGAILPAKRGRGNGGRGNGENPAGRPNSMPQNGGP